MKAISLFSNCGAGDFGYHKAGFDFEIMAELNSSRLAVALTNHATAEGIEGDLRTTWPTVVKKWREKEGDARPDLLAACPPCQGMSSARGGLGSHSDPLAGGKDPRNLLVTVIESVARALQPRVIVVENVPAFLTRVVPHPTTGEPISAALLLVEALSQEYRVFSMVADLADWGVPQTRKRAFLTLIRVDESGLGRHPDFAPFPRPTHAEDWGGKQITITEHLNEMAITALDAKSAESAVDPTNAMHFVPVWGERQYKMISAIPSRSGLGAWANLGCSACSAVTSDKDAAACAECGEPLLRPVVQENGRWRLIKGFRNSSYTRMRAEAPASTVTTGSGRVGSDKTIHPWENRVLSPYECASIQTLPEDFDWGDSLERCGATKVREMIGEAVPPHFTELHGRAVLAFLSEDEDGGMLLPINDRRAVKAASELKLASLKRRESAATRRLPSAETNSPSVPK